MSTLMWVLMWGRRANRPDWRARARAARRRVELLVAGGAVCVVP